MAPRATVHRSGDLAAEVEITGRTLPVQRLRDIIRRVAPHKSNFLLVGESGTGKELVARAIHAASPRRSEPFVAVNCATLNESLLENELFGHEKGAFTGADSRMPGVLETADRGTVLLDEINQTSMACQAKLLRVLERREFRRIGGTEKIKIDLCVIASTNVDLRAEMASHRFREDLYFRLKVVQIEVPPLRERRDDIPHLISSFLLAYNARFGRDVRGVTPEAARCLRDYPWPGNIRELKHTIESIFILSDAEMRAIGVGELPAEIRGVIAPRELLVRTGMRMDEIEREVLRLNLAHYATKKQAARALGIGLRTLHAKVARYGLREPIGPTGSDQALGSG